MTQRSTNTDYCVARNDENWTTESFSREDCNKGIFVESFLIQNMFCFYRHVLCSEMTKPCIQMTILNSAWLWKLMRHNYNNDTVFWNSSLWIVTLFLLYRVLHTGTKDIGWWFHRLISYFSNMITFHQIILGTWYHHICACWESSY